MSMVIDEFDYYLPSERIAQSPLARRDSSKLLLLNKKTGTMEHKIFHEIVDCLDTKDILVFNDTKVIPARLFGKKESGAKIEIFLLRRLSISDWEVLVRPGKKAQLGVIISFAQDMSCEIIAKTQFGGRIARFYYKGVFEEQLASLGEVPLPPYIHEKLLDFSRYQTIYAQHDGSVAAPTAGLHFTEELLSRIKSKRVQLAFVTLHVGLGTFRPVRVDTVEEHKMHNEYYTVTKETAAAINNARQKGGRVIAVGTTAVRVLESVGTGGTMHEAEGSTEIFIYPGYQFKMVDALVTNFHLPKSTLLMLVSALSQKEMIFSAYNTAIENDYRFFSFGDAMFIY